MLVYKAIYLVNSRLVTCYIKGKLVYYSNSRRCATCRESINFINKSIGLFVIKYTLAFM